MKEKLTTQDILKQGKKFGRTHMRVISNLPWSTEAPLEGLPLIVAELDSDFCHDTGVYRILHWVYGWGMGHPDGYYDDSGENVPMSAIIQWFELK